MYQSLKVLYTIFNFAYVSSKFCDVANNPIINLVSCSKNKTNHFYSTHIMFCNNKTQPDLNSMIHAITYCIIEFDSVFHCQILCHLAIVFVIMERFQCHLCHANFLSQYRLTIHKQQAHSYSNYANRK